MTVPLTGVGGLFTRLGQIFNIFRLVNTFRGTTIPPLTNTLQTEYDTTDQNLIDNLYANQLSFQNSSSSYLQAQRSLATSTVIQMVTDDQPQSTQSSLSLSLAYIINQMVTASATVQRCNASATVTAASANIGNAIVTTSIYNALGLVNEDLIGELITGVVTSDSITGRSIAGQETLSFKGQFAISDPLSWQYPVGSGSSQTFNCISPASNQTYLSNGAFENFNNQPNVPDSWLVSVGTPGTTIKKSTSVFYDGAASVNFAGNGSELTTIYQQFGAILASGTPTREIPFDHVGWNVWVYADAPAAGVLQVALVNGSGTVINDFSGNPNSKSLNLATITASAWTSFHGYFRTPRVLPAAVRLQAGLTTALSAGHNVYLDRFGYAQPVLMYPGGVSIMSFSGNVNLISGDGYQVQTYNDYGGKFQTDFDKFFLMKQLGYLLPSSASPTISDSLD